MAGPGGVSRQLHAARSDDGPPQRLPQVHGHAHGRSATFAGFNIGGGTFDVDLALRGPSWRSSPSTEAIKLKPASWRDRGRGHHAPARQARVRVAIDRTGARPTCDVDTAVSAAPHGGRVRPGLGFHDRSSTTTTTADPPWMPSPRATWARSRVCTSPATRPRPTRQTGAPAQVNLAPGGGLVRSTTS